MSINSLTDVVMLLIAYFRMVSAPLQNNVFVVDGFVFKKPEVGYSVIDQVRVVCAISRKRRPKLSFRLIGFWDRLFGITLFSFRIPPD